MNTQEQREQQVKMYGETIEDFMAVFEEYAVIGDIYDHNNYGFNCYREIKEGVGL